MHTQSAGARRLTAGKMAAYLVIFFAIWTLRELFLRERVAQWLGPWGGAVAGVAVKLLVWTVPALLLARRYREDMAVPALFGGPVRWPRVAMFAAGLMLFSVASSLIARGTLAIRADFRPIDLLGTVLFVGITEEAVFRGFVLNAFARRMDRRVALAASALLFVLIHFPIWYTRGLFASGLEVFRSSLSIFVLGVLFGMTFLQERSLWAPIVLHMAWNLPALLFFG